MNIWAPVVRFYRDGVGQFTNDSNSFSVGLGIFTVGATAADCAAHGSAGETWSDAYGEVGVRSISTTTGNKAGCWLRVLDSSNYYAVYISFGSPSTINIDSVVAGSTTALASVSFTLGTLSGIAGTELTFRAEVQGSSIRGYWRGALIASVQDTALTSAGFVSMFARAAASTQVQLSRFEAGPLGVAYPAGPESQQPGRRHR